ncbi:MAG: Hpt domain-containing protein [Sedimentisphaerales bacterium]|nr:Hpt domain-containing protein [Sedimentisphaerales bacterium]
MSDNQDHKPSKDCSSVAAGKHTSIPVQCDIDWNRLLEICDDEDILVDVTEAFRLDAPDTIKQLCDAAVQGDWATVQSCAHRLRGSTAVIGATQAMDNSGKLEMMCQNGEHKMESTMHLVDQLREEVEALVALLGQSDWIDLVREKTAEHDGSSDTIV